MGLYLGSKAGHQKEQGLTKMHEVHADAERDQACGNIPAGIAASSECNEWYKHNASHAHNSILAFLRKCRDQNKDCGITCMHGHWYNKPGLALDYKANTGVSKCEPDH